MTKAIVGFVAGLALASGYVGLASQDIQLADAPRAPTTRAQAPRAENPQPPAARPKRAPRARQTPRAEEPQSAAPKTKRTKTKPTGGSSPVDDPAFWGLIAETRSAAGDDTSRQSELLAERLAQLSPQAIVQFAQIRQRLDRRAYTYDVWAAAYVIEDGCSDDCFRDFRGYLISLGRSAYMNALRDPDSLATVVEDAETGNWENADNVAPDAYSSVTGGDFPLDDSDLSGPPRGTPFNENDTAALVRRYPRLASRFR
jgi:Protein of unknown function (DUF4240)